MNSEESVLSLLVAFARKQTALFEDFTKKLEKIQADCRVQEVGDAIRESHLGQSDLITSLLRNEGFKNLIKELNFKRAGYKEASFIIASTFPKGRFVTIRSVYQRLQLFGWTKGMTYNFLAHLGGRSFKWYDHQSSEEDKKFKKNLFDYELARSWRRPPTEAVCLNDERRLLAYQYLRDMGLGEVANIIQEKT